MKLREAILSLVVGLPLFVSAGFGQEPGWSPVIIARGEMRRHIEATPILERPYRPLHVYGNAVRRAHYRGSPLAVRR
ncbi:MAG: hypothetical protein GX575_15005 [Candidatus Anammoximicrobium sp.]|nr:hypothetical protein [Candidatus Anammoximicrobium sp.]